jgi:hypothetical protein
LRGRPCRNWRSLQGQTPPGNTTLRAEVQRVPYSLLNPPRQSSPGAALFPVAPHSLCFTSRREGGDGPIAEYGVVLTGACHLRLRNIVLRWQAGICAEGMACGLVAGRLWDSRVVQRGVSMHLSVLSRHFMKDVSLHACAIGGLYLSSSRRSVDMWRLARVFLAASSVVMWRLR